MPRIAFDAAFSRLFFSKKCKHAQLQERHVDDYIFYVALTVWMLAITFNHGTLFAAWITGKPMQAIRLACVALLVVAEILYLLRGNRWTRKTAVGFLVIAIAGVCCFNANRPNMLYALPFLFCARNRNLRTVALISIMVLSTVLVTTTLSAHFGILENHAFDGAGRARQGMGFRYPLYPAVFMLSVTFLILLLEGDEMRLESYAALVVANVFLLQLVDGRLSFATSIAAIVAAAVIQLVLPRTSGRKRLAAALSSAFAISAAVSIALALLYDPGIPWMAQLNTLFGGRLQLGHSGLGSFAITLLGHKVSLVGSALSATGAPSTKPYNFIDCAYLQYLLVFGVAYFVIFIAAMTAVTYRAFLHGHALLGVLLILMALHSIVDNQTSYLWCNPLLFVTASLMSDNEHYLEIG